MGHDPERAFKGDLEAFEAIVDAVLEELPEWVVARLDNLIVVVEDDPPRDSPDLLGLYEGVSLLDRSGEYTGVMPDQITVFRFPHVSIARDPGELAYEIRRTVLHEIGHYLGFTEQRLHELGWD